MAVEQTTSPAVQIAWKIASKAARSAGGSIDVPHFLYGIFSLENVATSDIPADMRTEAEAEILDLQHRLDAASVKAQDLRRKIRAQVLPASDSAAPVAAAPAANSASRSPAVRQAFDRAAVSGANGSAQVGLIALSRALLQQDPDAVSWFAGGEPELQTLLAELKGSDFPSEELSQNFSDDDGAFEGLSIFQSLDAEAVADGKVNWSVVGEPFAELCELTWQTGTSCSIEKLFDDAIHVLLRAIPAADHAAIMVEDSCGDLLLKAHHPKGVMPVSTSSAMKAIESRQSFIWQRGEDLSASQLASDLRAGLYAPILAAGKVFGVVCLDAHAAASRFTKEDLFLVTSLGHQLGLMLANRNLEQELRQSAKLLERLLTNFSPKVRDRLLLKAGSGRLKLGGERSVISILSSDVRGFTQLTANMDAEEIVSMLNDYFSAMVAVVFKHGGSIDKFIGDALLAVFGSPEADASHPENSLRAALEMQTEIAKVSAHRQAAGLPHCQIGIGVHTGEVIHGFIGSPDRMEFTVIGAAVNMASRFCDAAGGGQVFLSPELLEKVWKEAVVEPVEIATKHEGKLPGYKLLDMRPRKN